MTIFVAWFSMYVPVVYISHSLFSLTTQQELSEHREGISKEVEQLSQQLEHSRSIQVINKGNYTVTVFL